jgi:hypothetical protein
MVKKYANFDMEPKTVYNKYQYSRNGIISREGSGGAESKGVILTIFLSYS